MPISENQPNGGFPPITICLDSKLNEENLINKTISFTKKIDDKIVSIKDIMAERKNKKPFI